MNRLELIKFIRRNLKTKHKENNKMKNKTKNKTKNKKRRTNKKIRKLLNIITQTEGISTKRTKYKRKSGGGLKEAYDGVFRTLKNLLTKKSDKDEEYSNMSKDYKRLLSM